MSRIGRIACFATGPSSTSFSTVRCAQPSTARRVRPNHQPSTSFQTSQFRCQSLLSSLCQSLSTGCPTESRTSCRIKSLQTRTVTSRYKDFRGWNPIPIATVKVGTPFQDRTPPKATYSVCTVANRLATSSTLPSLLRATTT